MTILNKTEEELLDGDSRLKYFRKTVTLYWSVISWEVSWKELCNEGHKEKVVKVFQIR